MSPVSACRAEPLVSPPGPARQGPPALCPPLISPASGTMGRVQGVGDDRVRKPKTAGGILQPVVNCETVPPKKEEPATEKSPERARKEPRAQGSARASGFLEVRGGGFRSLEEPSRLRRLGRSLGPGNGKAPERARKEPRAQGSARSLWGSCSCVHAAHVCMHGGPCTCTHAPPCMHTCLCTCTHAPFK